MSSVRELIERAQCGERITSAHSLHKQEVNTACDMHNWRVIVCDHHRDVEECSHCGRQRITACSFDEDMS